MEARLNSIKICLLAGENCFEVIFGLLGLGYDNRIFAKTKLKQNKYPNDHKTLGHEYTENRISFVEKVEMVSV